jgi:hypothetical protein
MNDTEMTQEQWDTEEIARMYEHVTEYNDLSQRGVRYWSLSRYTSSYMFERFTSAALREIARLRAAHAADCIQFAEILEREGFRMDGRVFRAKAAQLAAPADGSGAGTGDGGEGR